MQIEVPPEYSHEMFDVEWDEDAQEYVAILKNGNVAYTVTPHSLAVIQAPEYLMATLAVLHHIKQGLH
ncbi:MAG: hypothetical protein VW498_02070 [Candidatus Thalassarchaeaceae archaeon]